MYITSQLFKAHNCEGRGNDGFQSVPEQVKKVNR